MQARTADRSQGTWCRGRGSNPHDRFRSRDFKSRASASFATPAWGESVDYAACLAQNVVLPPRGVPATRSLPVNFLGYANKSPHPFPVTWFNARRPVQRRASSIWPVGCPMSCAMRDQWTEMREDIERSVVRLRASIAETHALIERLETRRPERAILARIPSTRDGRCGTAERGHNPCS